MSGVDLIDYTWEMDSSFPALLDPDQLAQSMSELHPDWSVVDGKLHREVQLRDFASAFGCMAEIAIHADKMRHHPEWFNVYNRIVVDLTTHDSGGLTQSDIDLAKVIDTAVAHRTG